MSTIEPTPGADPGSSHVVLDPRRQRNILIAMCTSLVAVVASVSGLNVAQQALAVDLGASQGDLLWIINGYTIALAALLLPLGAVGDRWGRKWLLVAGLVIFAAANLVAAAASSVTVLLLARIVGGAGAALIMPVTLSTITATFPAEQKARAIGIWSGFAGAGGIIGLFASSLIIDEFTWPWVFALPIVLAGVSLAYTLAVVDNSREEHEGTFDVLGSLLSAVAVGSLVLGIHEGPEKGWSASITVISLVVGFAALAAFVLWELKRDHPLLDVRVFKNRSLATGSFVLLVIFGVMFGIFLVLLQFLMAVVGFSALKGASGLLPMAVVMMGLSGAAPRLAEKYGHKRILTIGISVFILGLVTLASMASADGGYWSVLPGLMVIGVGIGLSMTPATTAITGALPEAEQGVASALNDTVRELGGAVGVALLGSFLNSGYRSGVAGLEGTIPDAAYEPVKQGIGGALAVAETPGMPPELAETLRHTAREAFMDGWTGSMWVGVGLAGAALVFLLVRGMSPPISEGEDIDAELADLTDESPALA